MIPGLIAIKEQNSYVNLVYVIENYIAIYCILCELNIRIGIHVKKNLDHSLVCVTKIILLSTNKV